MFSTQPFEVATDRWVRSDEWVSEEDPSGPVFRAKQGGPSHRQTYRCNRDTDGKTAEKEKRNLPDKQAPTHTHTHIHTQQKETDRAEIQSEVCVNGGREAAKHPPPHTHPRSVR